MKFTPRDAFSKDNWIIDSESILQVLKETWICMNLIMKDILGFAKKNPLVKAENDLFDATHL